MEVLEDLNQIPEGFKMTELGPLPEDWEVVRLIDYVNLERGTEPGSNSYNKDGKGVRFIRIVDLSGSREDIIYTTSDNIKLCEAEDILITFDGSPGIVKRGYYGAYSSGIRKVIFQNTQLNKDFTYFVLQTSFVQNEIEKFSTGITIKHASKSIPHIKIPLPPIEEQKAIAYVLSSVQAVIEKTEAVIKAIKELKKSLMKHLFTYGPVPLDEIDKVKLKDTEIGPILEDWEVVRLGEVADLVMGQSPPGESYNEEYKGMPFLQGKAEFGYLHPKHKKFTTKPIKIAKKGSILLSIRAPVGDVNIADIDYCIGRGLCSLSLKEGYNIFLFYLLYHYKSKIENEGVGSTFKSINKNNLQNFKIPLPPLPIQQKIAEILSAVDQKIQAEENKKKALNELFKSLLHNLMTGKIRVKDLRVEDG